MIDGRVNQILRKEKKKKIQFFFSRDRPRPLLFENFNQRTPPLAKLVASVFLHKDIDPTECLRNHLRIVRSVTIGRFI